MSRWNSSPIERGTRAILCTVFFACIPAFSAPLSVVVLKRDGTPLQGAVVSAQSESHALPPAPPVKGVMDQVDLTFVPDVLVIPVHSTVQFPNSDAISHQVYSFSSAKSFQLPLYRGKPYPPVSFDQPGIVTMGCNIHDNMLSYIIVTAAPFFGRTDKQGAWSADVPQGRYRLWVWHPLLNEPQEVERVVDAGAQSPIEVRLQKNLKPAPLKGRPHSWDY